MKGDFSRLTFDATKHFSRVMMQQGRVQLDADWNEQHAIFLHYLQTLTKDLIGEHGGPAGDLGFEIITDAARFPEETIARYPQGLPPFLIGGGRYYVNGIQVTAEDSCSAYDQPDLPYPTPVAGLDKGHHLVYLDVWEHHITSFEDPSIREVALENLDTASRAKIVWQVKTVPLTGLATTIDLQAAQKISKAKLAEFIDRPRAYLTASTAQKNTSSEPCSIPSESAYRGQENQLYRVEIYNAENKSPKIKWARDNASVLTGAKLGGDYLTVNDPRGFKPGQWVEITNNDQELLEKSGQLIKIKTIEDNKFTLETKGTPLLLINNAKVRRWDGADIPAQDKTPIPLADGVSISLKAAAKQGIGYSNGDYWLIPVRVATGKVELPDEPQPPLGTEHHYAPLALIEIAEQNNNAVKQDLRYVFKSWARSTDEPVIRPDIRP